MLNRRLGFACSILVIAAISPAFAVDELSPAHAKADADGATLWYDLRDLGLEGKGFAETKSPYDRLPAKAEKVVSGALWKLARESAGIGARFETDAPTIQVRWTLVFDRLSYPSHSATGTSGVDLYVRAADDRGWKWAGAGAPANLTNSVTLISDLAAGNREFLLYLPLYNGVSSVEIGIPKNSKLSKAAARTSERQKPIVFYGTSITQGGSASRAGMAATAIVGRRLDWPVINLGFSGNGKMEPEIVKMLAELDPALYVIDCVPNMTPEEIESRAEPLTDALLSAHPHTPLLLVDGTISYSETGNGLGRRERRAAGRAAAKKVFEMLATKHPATVHYFSGDRLLGDDGEGTVDGVHPNDLGFMRQAEGFLQVLPALLSRRER